MACCRSQWPRGLRRRSTAARLLRLSVRISLWAWMSVCCDCCVLSGRGLCYALITRPEESYRLWCVVVCDLETSRMRRPWPALGRSSTRKKCVLLNQNVINFGEEKKSCFRGFIYFTPDDGHMPILRKHGRKYVRNICLLWRTTFTNIYTIAC